VNPKEFVMEQLTRPVPTPGDLAIAHRPPAAASPALVPSYDRRAWESAVFASALHMPTRLIALLLAHHADASGHIPASGPQSAGRLARESGVSPKATRLALTKLELDGYIRRPDIHTWKAREVRPITLALPASAAARTEPPHTGQPR
jgi:hypothetical protein